nr:MULTISPECIES: hypothetical protein [unclassified Meiothermus]
MFEMNKTKEAATIATPVLTSKRPKVTGSTLVKKCHTRAANPVTRVFWARLKRSLYQGNVGLPRSELKYPMATMSIASQGGKIIIAPRMITNKCDIDALIGRFTATRVDQATKAIQKMMSHQVYQAWA